MTVRISKQAQDKMPPPRLTEIHLARKPLDGTVASTVLKWGTGALNIDSARLACGTDHMRGGVRTGIRRRHLPGDDRQGASLGMFQPGRAFQATDHTGGRWPTNLILQHFEGCEKVGVKLVRGTLHGDALVDDWACIEGCPCLGLKESGPAYSDEGGADRYFKQVLKVQDLHEYLRTMISPPPGAGKPVAVVITSWPENAETWAKASCSGFVIHGFTPTEAQMKTLYDILTPGGHICLVAPDTQPTGHTGACLLEDTGFEIRDAILWVRGSGRMHYVAKVSRQEREAGCQQLPSVRKRGDMRPSSGKPEEQLPNWFWSFQTLQNFHPCVKPIAVMDRLLADVPKGIGPVLDPFLGSGTTMIACLRSGHDGIGIEQQEEYLRISENRVRYWDRADQGWLGANIQSDLKNEATKAEPLDLFDLFDLFD